MKRTFLATLLGVGIALGFCVGCGNSSRDRPSDCTSDEFFNERTNRCVPCPALSPPDCPTGCGYEIFEADNGCPAARCASDCRVCELGERYSEEDGVCEPCPGVPDCERFACQGELRVEGSFRGACPPASGFACGDCLNPQNGCVADSSGNCIDKSD